MRRLRTKLRKTFRAWNNRFWTETKPFVPSQICPSRKHGKIWKHSGEEWNGVRGLSTNLTHLFFFQQEVVWTGRWTKMKSHSESLWEAFTETTTPLKKSHVCFCNFTLVIFNKETVKKNVLNVGQRVRSKKRWLYILYFLYQFLFT